MAGPVNSQRL